ncbi:hypothetical protein ACFL6N_03895 [Thermodesulfobacteriota bacterium]
MNVLQVKTILFIVTVLVIIPGLSLMSYAESVKSCHCFKERAYNPQEKFAADDYILASSFNSLLSKSFDIPKRQIVMLKMQGGVGQNDLLIGLKIAGIIGGDLNSLLKLRQTKTWQAILSDSGLVKNVNDNELIHSIQKGISDQEAGHRIADALIGELYHREADHIAKIRTAGLNEKEINLLYILAHTAKKKPEDFLSLYKNKGKSWSEIAADLGIEAAEVGKLIMNL